MGSLVFFGPTGKGKLLPKKNLVGCRLNLMTLTPRQLSASGERKAKLLTICNALPEVAAEAAGEHLCFRIRKKTLGYYLFDHHGDGIVAFCCKSSVGEQRQLIREDPESFFVPAYLGSKGWIAIRLDLAEVDWEAVDELARRAYQALAPRKLAALVD
mgnify:CR=1 FL=1